MATTTSRQFSFRKNGKVHRAVEILEDGQKPGQGWSVCSCRCPGSQRGTLIKGSVFIAEGHEASNCGG